MADLDDIFKENIKKSFEKVKEDYNELKNELKSQKNLIYKLNELLSLLTSKFEELSHKIEKKPENNLPFFDSSTGNEGVQSITQQSLSNQSLSTQPINIINFTNVKEIENAFKMVTKQEFLLFLAIYQIEDDKGRPVTYEDLKTHTKLSKSGIRGYISGLIMRGLPLEKRLINNRVVSLSIPRSFRELGIKAKLLEIYKKNDPAQTKLSDI